MQVIKQRIISILTLCCTGTSKEEEVSAREKEEEALQAAQEEAVQLADKRLESRRCADNEQARSVRVVASVRVESP